MQYRRRDTKLETTIIQIRHAAMAPQSNADRPRRYRRPRHPARPTRFVATGTSDDPIAVERRGNGSGLDHSARTNWRRPLRISLRHCRPAGLGPEVGSSLGSGPAGIARQVAGYQLLEPFPAEIPTVKIIASHCGSGDEACYLRCPPARRRRPASPRPTSRRGRREEA
jgi:hypothetical protein